MLTLNGLANFAVGVAAFFSGRRVFRTPFSCTQTARTHDHAPTQTAYCSHKTHLDHRLRYTADFLISQN